jgi:hypothetical protein
MSLEQEGNLEATCTMQPQPQPQPGQGLLAGHPGSSSSTAERAGTTPGSTHPAQAALEQKSAYLR